MWSDFLSRGTSAWRIMEKASVDWLIPLSVGSVNGGALRRIHSDHIRHDRRSRDGSAHKGGYYNSGAGGYSLGNHRLNVVLSLLNCPWSCFHGVIRPFSVMDKPVKSKGTLYRRLLVQLLISFIIGILLGCIPASWFNRYRSGLVKHELMLEVNGLVRKLPGDRSQSGYKLIDRETVERSVRLPQQRLGEVNSEEDAPFQVGDIKVEEERFGGIAPGLNSTFDPERKLIIVITPTYNRPFQAHFLTRLAHTLSVVPPPLLWLVVEYPWASYETAAFLRHTGIMYRHLACRENITSFRDRGIYQRNRALKHIEAHQLDGIVYFANEDNIYSVELFTKLRKIKRFGIWPVGMLSENKARIVVEGPVCDGDRVIGWHTNEKSKRLRRFHSDMAGFGFNSTILWNKSIWGYSQVQPIRQLVDKEGLQETTFVEQLVEDESQMEGLPRNCNKIMVWHVHLDKTSLIYPPGWTLMSPLEPNTPFRVF